MAESKAGVGNLIREINGRIADAQCQPRAIDVFAEAKGAGFDVKVVRELIKLRAQETAERKERASLLEIYANAIGLDLV